MSTPNPITYLSQIQLNCYQNIRPATMFTVRNGALASKRLCNPQVSNHRWMGMTLFFISISFLGIGYVHHKFVTFRFGHKYVFIADEVHMVIFLPSVITNKCENTVWVWRRDTISGFHSEQKKIVNAGVRDKIRS